MAQVRYHNYKDSIESFPFNRARGGLIGPGRYAGFDTITNKVGLNFDIAHTSSGRQMLELDNITQALLGFWVTTNGAVISESANLSFSIDTNAGNASVRWDFLVGEFEWLASMGGQAATYFILKGPNSGGLPTLSNPEKQVILGRLLIPAGATDLTGVTYTPEACPFLGDMTYNKLYDILDGRYARKQVPNNWSAIQSFGKTVIYVVGPDKYIPVQRNYNSYEGANDATVKEIAITQDGAEIFLMNNSAKKITILFEQTPTLGGLKIKHAAGATDLPSLVMYPGDYLRAKQVGSTAPLDYYQVLETSWDFRSKIELQRRWQKAVYTTASYFTFWNKSGSNALSPSLLRFEVDHVITGNTWKFMIDGYFNIPSGSPAGIFAVKLDIGTIIPTATWQGIRGLGTAQYDNFPQMSSNNVVGKPVFVTLRNSPGVERTLTFSTIQQSPAWGTNPGSMIELSSGFWAFTDEGSGYHQHQIFFQGEIPLCTNVTANDLLIPTTY